MITEHEARAIVQSALKEDIPDQDITTAGISIEGTAGRARLVAREDLVLSGVDLFDMTFHERDALIRITWHYGNGSFILKNQTICTLHGNLAAMLSAERVALNFLGHLSGVATLTHCFVEQTKGTDTKILDTRKTIPGLRRLQKRAVLHGGGQNHRLDLSSGILIKENHIRAAGGMKLAIEKIRAKFKEEIEVEVQNLSEAQLAVELGVAKILLDNMSNEEMAKALRVIPSTIKTEASGNMNIDRIASVAALGVSYISVGALTHSAPTADLSLLFD